MIVEPMKPIAFSVPAQAIRVRLQNVLDQLPPGAAAEASALLICEAARVMAQMPKEERMAQAIALQKWWMAAVVQSLMQDAAEGDR